MAKKMKNKREYKDISYIWADQYGIIGQPYPKGVEGGDSANYNGHYNYFSDHDDKVDYVKTFEVGFGGYVRHPHKHPIYNKFGSYYKNAYCGVISRDQKIGILAGLIDAKDFWALVRFTLNWLCKLMLFSNNIVHNGIEPSKYKFNLLRFFYNPKQEPYYKLPDITIFDMWAALLRAFSQFVGPFKVLFFLPLCILDLQMLVNTLLVNRSDKDIQQNYLLKLHISRKFVPTPISKLSVILLDKEHLKDRLKEAWTKWRDNPGMYDLHERAIDRLV